MRVSRSNERSSVKCEVLNCFDVATMMVYGTPVCEKHYSDMGVAAPDMVNHPPHYKDRVPGIECIDVTKHFGFCRGNAIKYLWRAGLKGDSLVEDLKKAIWYIEQEIKDANGA